MGHGNNHTKLLNLEEERDKVTPPRSLVMLGADPAWAPGSDTFYTIVIVGIDSHGDHSWGFELDET